MTSILSIKLSSLFKIPQIVAPGELEDLELFPSFCFFFDKKLNKEEMMNPAWNSKSPYTVGSYARDYGATVPNRFISSAKSWLCHSGVERKEKILPWGGNLEEVMHSPLSITSFYLSYIKKAWNHKYAHLKDSFGNLCLFEDQNIIITIPASFDETARELTIEAAKLAGCRQVNLIEEPLAAFYSWLDMNAESWQNQIQKDEKVLVIDIGGGTSDFSIIALNENGALERTAAGNHLLLGGDNIDIAIAKKIEEKWKTELSHGDWLTLCQKTRQAKELLLNQLELKSTDITLLSQGSSIIGNLRKYTLERSELEGLLIEGFFPFISSDSSSPLKKKGIQKMGLPYESDPSIPSHLLQFLKYAQSVSAKSTKETGILLFPNKVLFNGGTMIPKILRERIISSIQNWFDGKNIQELASRDLTLAVAYGASYYGRTKVHGGVKVKTAASKSYYLKVAHANKSGADKVICIMPRGADENLKVHTQGSFTVETNKTVHFPLFSSATRIGDKAGVFLEESEDISFVSSLFSILRYGTKQEKIPLKAGIVSELTESGVLKIEIESQTTSHKWPLKFDVRLINDEDTNALTENLVTFDHETVEKSKAFLKGYFSLDKSQNISIFKELEAITSATREKWPMHFLRSLADTLLDIDYKTLILADFESRWLNICGFVLRPGFGDPEDEIRLRKAWQLWPAGLNNPNDPQTVSEWWVFWRRIISGLKSGHQISIYNELSKHLLPKGIYQQRIKLGEQAKAEMFRCLGSLELISEKQKKFVGNILIERGKKLESYEYWVLARIGARKLFHASANCVIGAKTSELWISMLLKGSTPSQDKLFAISRMAALTPDRALNVSSETVLGAISFLRKAKAPVHWIKHLETVTTDDTQEKTKLLGDSIPLGITVT